MSLKIEKKNEADPTLVLTGRLDTVTAPELEKAVAALLPQVDSLVLDLHSLEYISSAGLRVILKAYKALAHRNGLKLTGVQEAVKEVFDITGFSDFLMME